MMRTTKKPARRGITLIVVLWAVALLAILVTNFAFLVRTHTMVVANFSNDVRLQTIAESGIERAIAELKDDQGNVDTLMEDWADDEKDFAEVGMGDGQYTIMRFDSENGAIDERHGLVDEASKLNLHTATREMLMKLENVDGPMASAILDWQDDDAEVQPDGAEAEFYANLDKPTPCKDAPLTTVEELLLVRGVTPEILYGEDWNQNGVLDPAENDGDDHDPPDDRDGELDRGILPYVTVYSKENEKSADGKDRIDINSADENALKQGVPSLTDDEAKAIVAFRQQKQFEHLGDLIKVTKPKEDDKNEQQQDQKKDGENSGEEQQRNQQQQEEQKPPPVQQQNQPQGQQDGQQGQGGERVFTADRLKQIIDYCKIGGDTSREGRVNINTAPWEVLRCLPGIGDDLARTIVSTRDQQRRSYNTIADLMDVPGMTEDIFGGVSDFVTVRSYQFHVRSDAMMEGTPARRTVQAVLDRTDTEVKILYWNAR